jgi:hypothetical protein
MVSRRAIRAAAAGGRGKRVPEDYRLPGGIFQEDLHDVRKEVMDKYHPTERKNVYKCDDIKSCRKGSHARGSIAYNNEGEITNKLFERKQKTNKVKKPATKRKTAAKKK